MLFHNFNLPLILSLFSTSTVLLPRLIIPRNPQFFLMNLPHSSPLLPLLPTRLCSLAISMFMSTLLLTHFLNLLSSVNLVQHVNFPTHIENHTLDLLITSTASLLSPKVPRSAFNITDHFLIMADLEIKPFVRPPPPTHSFRLTGSIDRPAFIKNILDSQLILNPPSSLEDLLSCYNSTLSNLLNIHAPLITKQSSHANNPWFTS